MAIDLRANVRCNLGRLVEGSISDDYIQGAGLIKTSGSCIIDGTITPAPGTIVIFQYTKGGVTRTVPRKMRVMSSFADPFRGVTTVELGCKLTYLDDLTDPINWSAYDDPFNDSLNAEDRNIVVLPISARGIAEKCLQELGIRASSMPLTNFFSIPSFDFSSGYVNILGNLLVSESFFGYLDFNETLQISSLIQPGGSGPVLGREQLVDVGPIGVGQLPGESVVVSYSTLKLRPPDPEEDDSEEAVARRDWEFESTREPYSFVLIEVGRVGTQSRDVMGRYTGTFYRNVSVEYGWFPYSETVTEYDSWDRVTKKTTIKRSIVAEYNTEPSRVWWSRRKAFTVNWEGSIGIQPGRWQESEVEQETITTYQYGVNAVGSEKEEGYDEILSETTEVWGPSALALGGLTLKYWRGSGTIFRITTLEIWLPPVNDRVLIERVVIEYESEGRSPQYLSRKEVDLFPRLVDIGYFPMTKKVTRTWRIYCKTQRGQAHFAGEYYNAQVSATDDPGWDYGSTGGIPPEQSAARALTLVYDGESVNTVSGREAFLEGRPSAEERRLADQADGGDPNNGYQTSSVESLELALGSAAAQRRIEFSMPFASDDRFAKAGDGTFSSIQSDAPQKARNYGRAQNRILMGNRNGMNIQAAPELLPPAPLSPVYINAGGRTVMYRGNAMGWTMDQSGIVASSDAIHWGQAT